MDLFFTGIIWLFAGFINGLSGMGLALVAVPLLTLFMDIQIIIPLACIMVTIACAILAFHFREHCDWSAVSPFIFSSLPGSILGAYILKFIPILYLQMSMSIFLISYVLWSLTYKQKNKEFKENKPFAIVCGFLSGVSGAAISFAGPPLAIYVIYAGWNAKKTLANMSFGMFLISLITCTTHFFAGLYTKELIPYVLVGIPTISLGIVVSFPLIKYITQKTFKRLLLVIIGISGFVAGIRAIIQLGLI